MEFDIEYNSQAEKLLIPEYGRHVQSLVRHCQKMEDAEKRQAFAEQVVNLMHQMNPQNKNVQEYRNRLWKHFFFIAEYNIDVKARHYGTNVKTLIEKAIKMEDGPIKDGFVETIAGFMKMAYKNWNREHYVSDEIVLGDLKAMSDGKLVVADTSSLDTLAKAVRHKRRPQNNNDSRRRGGRNSGGRNNNRRNNNKRRGGRR